MARGRVILENEQFQLTIDRLCHQIIENYSNFSELCIVGIQEKGVVLAQRIVESLIKITGVTEIHFGKLDITFYRDDFRRRDIPLKANSTEMDFLVEGKNVILIDDVLYSGRTIQAGLLALQQFGRANKIELLCLVDRRFNRELPIQSDYTGVRVDAIDEAYVQVEMDKDGSDRILLFSAKRTEK